MSSRSATARASIASVALQQVLARRSGESPWALVLRNRPMTSCPARFRSKAATELSTPPLIATTTRDIRTLAPMFCENLVSRVAGWHGHVLVAMSGRPQLIPHGHEDVTMPPGPLLIHRSRRPAWRTSRGPACKEKPHPPSRGWGVSDRERRPGSGLLGGIRGGRRLRLLAGGRGGGRRGRRGRRLAGRIVAADQGHRGRDEGDAERR